MVPKKKGSQRSYKKEDTLQKRRNVTKKTKRMLQKKGRGCYIEYHCARGKKKRDATKTRCNTKREHTLWTTRFLFEKTLKGRSGCACWCICCCLYVTNNTHTSTFGSPPLRAFSSCTREYTLLVCTHTLDIFDFSCLTENKRLFLAQSSWLK